MFQLNEDYGFSSFKYLLTRLSSFFHWRRHITSEGGRRKPRKVDSHLIVNQERQRPITITVALSVAWANQP